MMKLKKRTQKYLEKLFSVRILRSAPHGLDLPRDIGHCFPNRIITLIFDVGANIGQSTAEFLDEFPEAMINCFEPMPATFDKLSERFSGRRNVKCWNLAFGNMSASVVMAEGLISTTNRVAGLSADHDGCSRLETVQMSTIDAFCDEKEINKIGLLKIDTEGHDLAVLEGAEFMLATQRIELVQVEVGMSRSNEFHVPYQRMKQYLNNRNYHLFGLYNQAMEWPTSEPRLRRLDAVFVCENMIRSSGVPQRIQRSHTGE